MKIGPVDFKQPSTWRGIAGFAALFGITASPEFTNAICIAIGAVLSAIEIGRNEFATRQAVNQRESAQSADAAFPAASPAAEPLRPPLPPANDLPMTFHLRPDLATAAVGFVCTFVILHLLGVLPH